MKETWYNIVQFGFKNNPTRMWEDRHVKVTIGERHVDKVYYLFNDEPLETMYDTFEEDSDFSTQFIQITKGFETIVFGTHVLLGICGKFELVKSNDENEFKIEFL